MGGIRQGESHESEQGKGLKFGKYYLHAGKLKGGIVCVRTSTVGRNHPQMPTKRVSVSKGMGMILRRIAKGGSPSYDELHRLSDEDRTHLSDLVRRCKVDVTPKDPPELLGCLYLT